MQQRNANLFCNRGTMLAIDAFQRHSTNRFRSIAYEPTDDGQVVAESILSGLGSVFGT